MMYKNDVCENSTGEDLIPKTSKITTEIYQSKYLGDNRLLLKAVIKDESKTETEKDDCNTFEGNAEFFESKTLNRKDGNRNCNDYCNDRETQSDSNKEEGKIESFEENKSEENQCENIESDKSHDKEETFLMTKKELDLYALGSKSLSDEILQICISKMKRPRGASLNELHKELIVAYKRHLDYTKYVLAKFLKDGLEQKLLHEISYQKFKI